MISQTAEYALRAMVHIASNGGKRHVTQDIAGATQVPTGYLAKVLQRLHKSGLVSAQRGLGGGYGLSRPANQITLHEIISAVDPIKHFELPSPAENQHSLNTLQSHLNEITGIMESEFKKRTILDLVAR